jgi:hypothetical protein
MGKCHVRKQRFQSRHSCLFQGNITALPWKLIKPPTANVRIVDNPTDIRIEYLLNPSLERYRYTDLLDHKELQSSGFTATLFFRHIHLKV